MMDLGGCGWCGYSVILYGVMVLANDAPNSYKRILSGGAMVRSSYGRTPSNYLSGTPQRTAIVLARCVCYGDVCIACVARAMVWYEAGESECMNTYGLRLVDSYGWDTMHVVVSGGS
jgi:hypothetical protein